MQIKKVSSSNKTLPIVFAFNNKYCKFFSATLYSLVYNSSKNFNYDIIILSSDISERNKKLLEKMVPENFCLRFYNITEDLDKIINIQNLKPRDYWSAEMYYRLFIPLIMRDYKRVLYLDADIIIHDNIESFFDKSFCGKQILAAFDTISNIVHLPEHKKRYDFIKKTLKLERPDEYFNSGVILFNIPVIDEKIYLENLIFLLENQELMYPDQDILNIIFHNKVKFIGCEWNYCCNAVIDKSYLEQITGQYREDFLSAKKNPKIIHYISHIKPWNSSGYDYSEVFWQNARKTPFYEEVLYYLQQYQIEDSMASATLFAKIQNSKKYLLWGASLFLEEFIEKYKITDDNILGIIDLNRDKEGHYIGKYKIYSPEILKVSKADEIVLTIKNKKEERYQEIKRYLEENQLMHIKLSTI